MTLAALNTFLVPAAVALADGDFGPHVGLVYRPKKKERPRILHLAWHFDLRDEAATATILTSCMFVVPAIDELELLMLASLCAKRAALPKNTIPYGFAFRGASTLAPEGQFVAGPGASGLTCATFVHAMFDWARIPLLRLDTWRPRPEDGTFWEELLKRLKERKASPAHLADLRGEVHSVRYRAEEVAAASAIPSRPVDFTIAAPAGETLAHNFYECVGATP